MMPFVRGHSSNALSTSIDGHHEANSYREKRYVLLGVFEPIWTQIVPYTVPEHNDLYVPISIQMFSLNTAHNSTFLVCLETLNLRPSPCWFIIPVRAEHGCRSLWVTCGFTHGNTCKDPDLQVQVTCSRRSLRVQVWKFLDWQVPVWAPKLCIIENSSQQTHF